ncbi:hypothetical protein GCM10027277_25770 [Pseudoduganella ginsengisoli]|uniref:Uncharacterized protein n=1 Tax=Pseudoduganella ginsengisoli TaxID=1462440 RepID=A0A6L6Q0Z9_9BURK|nr:hypothetical protein [Pseudoduganella ginsengisoli]MTW02702.1 hypothetical protein [Pseudoduganella ginsengisoli]
MIDSEDPSSIVEVDFERDILPHLEAMDPDARLACEKLIIWLSERPKDAEPLSQQQMDEMVEEIRLENIRRRLGGKVGCILPFKKPTSATGAS